MQKKIIQYALAFTVSFSIAYSYFSFILLKKYTSTAVVYPTSTLNPQYLLEAGLRFGDEKELNEIIEVLNSNDVAIKVIVATTKDSIENHNSLEMSLAIKELNKNTEIKRGINRSVYITVKDEDPFRAALIANSYSKAAYEHLSELVIHSVKEHLNVMSYLYDQKLQEVAVLQDTLEKLEVLGASSVSGMVLVKTPRYRFFDTKFEFEMRKLGEIKNHKEHLEGIIKKNLPQLFVVSQARAATERPKNSNIVNSAIFAVFSVLLLAVLHNRKLFLNGANA
jgi:hypothetical protein